MITSPKNQMAPFSGGVGGGGNLKRKISSKTSNNGVFFCAVLFPMRCLGGGVILREKSHLKLQMMVSFFVLSFFP